MIFFAEVKLSTSLEEPTSVKSPLVMLLVLIPSSVPNFCCTLSGYRESFI